MGLVTPDIRQESSRHTDAIDTITNYVGIGSYKEWDEDKRVEFLIGELTGKRPLMPPGTPQSTPHGSRLFQVNRPGCFKILHQGECRRRHIFVVGTIICVVLQAWRCLLR